MVKEIEMRADSKISLTQKNIIVAGVFVFIGLIVLPAIASDRYVDNGDGTVTDTKTGLMWAATDNGDPVNWKDARSYCQNYSGGGHTDWQMPNLTELASLFDPKVKNKRGYHTNKLIETSAQSLWASDTREYKAGRFNFTYGQEYWLRQSFSGPTRVLPVRSGK